MACRAYATSTQARQRRRAACDPGAWPMSTAWPAPRPAGTIPIWPCSGSREPISSLASPCGCRSKSSMPIIPARHHRVAAASRPAPTAWPRATIRSKRLTMPSARSSSATLTSSVASAPRGGQQTRRASISARWRIPIARPSVDRPPTGRAGVSSSGTSQRCRGRGVPVRVIGPDQGFGLSGEGNGCHPVEGGCAARALTEAAQVRLTYIAGSREDTTWCFAYRPTTSGRGAAARSRGAGPRSDARLRRGRRLLDSMIFEPDSRALERARHDESPWSRRSRRNPSSASRGARGRAGLEPYHHVQVTSRATSQRRDRRGLGRERLRLLRVRRLRSTRRKRPRRHLPAARGAGRYLPRRQGAAPRDRHCRRVLRAARPPSGTRKYSGRWPRGYTSSAPRAWARCGRRSSRSSACWGWAASSRPSVRVARGGRRGRGRPRSTRDGLSPAPMRW